MCTGNHERKRRRFHDISLEARAYESTHSFFEYTEEKECTESFSVNSKISQSLEGLKYPETLESSLSYLSAFLVEQNPLSQFLLKDVLFFIIESLGCNALTEDRNVGVRFAGTEALCNILLWSDESCFQSFSFNFETAVQQIVSGLLCTVTYLQEQIKLDTDVEFILRSITKTFRLLSLLCEYKTPLPFILNAWQSIEKSLDNSNNSLSLQSVSIAFSSGFTLLLSLPIKELNFYFDTFHAATSFCTMFFYGVSGAAENAQNTITLNAIRKPLEVLLKSFIQGTLQTFLDELKKKDLHRENVVSMRWWSASISSLLLCFLEVCNSDELAIYQERFPAFFCTLQEDLYHDPYDAVCKTLSQIEGIMASSDISQSSTLINTFNLNKGERFDDKNEIANSRACHQLIKVCTKEIQLTGFIFSLLKRLLQLADPYYSTEILEEDDLDSNDNFESPIMLPQFFINYLDTDFARSLIDQCHQAIATVFQLPNLCTAVQSSFDSCRFEKILENYLITQQHTVKFFVYCILAANTPTNSVIFFKKKDFPSEPFATIFFFFRSLEVCSMGSAALHSCILTTLQSMTEACVLYVDRNMISDNASISLDDIKNLFNILETYDYPYQFSKQHVKDEDILKNLWFESQLTLSDLICALVNHCNNEDILKITLYNVLRIMEKTVDKGGNYLMLTCSLAEILFESFRDENYDFLFPQFDTLHSLSGILKKLKQQVSKVKVWPRTESSHLLATIENLKAFIVYKQQFQ
ncbi:uncharacterized protein LOC128884293 [Hylaeus volcanicus]|uniref:uncharacterized protein LOC128884293 n=1 Tax=Hylaeus volcanicus TaxID=313075 RepID=UPI0023B86258|nr:uncharacterized protein LOC128884293 [Hylaeus volcanicus]XP_053993557.1 uncharacterized protein LOC128884293 [Hylaeus volcanicus]XP_053993558.1 uncharacterized protein LOC128884293 [Hylaeus volcanicus]XP_053993560.1 uncharacterized protein LOC128884293 [Hylaeus volcanicus]